MDTSENTWNSLLAEEYSKPYFISLQEFVLAEYASAAPSNDVFPSRENIWNAFKFTSYENVKAVILGQDPYHTPGAAHGLCFSVKTGIKTPPSLINIFKEIHNEFGVSRENPEFSGELTDWAKNGVLLLNTILTVRQGKAMSHSGKGWEIFTDKVISLLNSREKPMVFMLWGRPARAKLPLITNKHHLVLTAAHPSPLSAHNGFFGCGHFLAANNFLKENNIESIRWI